MKKYIIGSMVLGVLIMYSAFIRHEQPKISPHHSLTVSNNPSTTTSGSGTPPTTKGSATGSTATSSGNSIGQNSATSYKDGSYTGSIANAYYGNVQVKATISGGKITDVAFLQYPDTHSTSVYINQQAMPYLQQEAIQAQSSRVNIISGATYTSQAFIQSLSDALSQA